MNDRSVGPTTTRRRLLGAAGGTVAGAYLLSGRSSGAAEDGGAQTETETATPIPPDPIWPLFQFDARNTGHQPNDQGPPREPGAAWAHLEGGEYTSTPVVTEGEVFAADEGAGVVRAFDVFTGEQQWEHSASTQNSRMTIKDRTLYVPTEQSGSQLEALNPRTGEREWFASLQGRANGVVAAGGSLYVSTVSGVSKVSTLSESVSWEYDEVTLSDTSIAVRENSVYAAGTASGKVVKLSVADGSSNWTTNLSEAAVGAPTVLDNKVYVPVTGGVVALKEGSGREVWRYDVPVGSSVAVADGAAYGTTTEGEAFALDLGSGSELWRVQSVLGSNPPLRVGNLLYVVGEQGTLAGMDRRDGSLIWLKDVGAEVAANPAVYGGDLYLCDRKGRVARLAEGQSGGYDTPTPSPTETDSPTRTRTDTPTETLPPHTTTDGSGDNGGTPTDDDDPVVTPTDDTPTGGSGDGGGGIDLPLIGGLLAAIVAAIGGGLWWRQQQQDDYDPLG